MTPGFETVSPALSRGRLEGRNLEGGRHFENYFGVSDFEYSIHSLECEGNLTRLAFTAGTANVDRGPSPPVPPAA